MNEILDDVEPMPDGSLRYWYDCPNGDVKIVTKYRGETKNVKTLEGALK